MYPTLYDFFLDAFGLEIGFFRFFNSFGVFVALAFLSANWIFIREMKRKEEEGILLPVKKKKVIGKPLSIQDIALNFVLGFLIGFKLLYAILNYEEATSDPQGFILSGKGSIIGGLLVGALFYWMRYRENAKERLPEPKEIEVEVKPYQHVGTMTLYAALFGIIGAKLFHLLENPDEFATFISGGSAGFFSGLTMYGGLIGGGAAVIIYMKRAGLKVFHSMDAVAAGLILAYGVGRIGCQVAGDGDWGIDNLAAMPGWMSFLPEWMWAYDYPNNVNEQFDWEGLQAALASMPQPIDFYSLSFDEKVMYAKEYGFNRLPNPVFPTPFYETIMSFIIFGILWAIRKSIRIGGVLFSVYLIFNGIERFLIEKIRVNELFWGTWTQAEVISSFLVLLGIAGILILRANKDTLAER